VKDFVEVNDDRTTDWAELEPLEKRQALLFYGQTLQGYCPDVETYEFMLGCALQTVLMVRTTLLRFTAH
jgi:hypothetical protein